MTKYALFFTMLFSLFVGTATADTLTFTGTGSNSVNGVYTYPYYFSVNGSATQETLMCLSYDNEITTGESWRVYDVAITTNSEKESAWLYNDAGLNSTNDVNDNLAAWSLFSNNVPTTPASDIQLAKAIAGVNTESPDFWNKFVIYVPDGDVISDPSLLGPPQIFVGLNQTPEPNSLMLLGTGLLLLSSLKYVPKIIAIKTNR